MQARLHHAPGVSRIENRHVAKIHNFHFDLAMVSIDESTSFSRGKSFSRLSRTPSNLSRSPSWLSGRCFGRQASVSSAKSAVSSNGATHKSLSTSSLGSVVSSSVGSTVSAVSAVGGGMGGGDGPGGAGCAARTASSAVERAVSAAAAERTPTELLSSQLQDARAAAQDAKTAATLAGLEARMTELLILADRTNQAVERGSGGGGGCGGGADPWAERSASADHAAGRFFTGAAQHAAALTAAAQLVASKAEAQALAMRSCSTEVRVGQPLRRAGTRQDDCHPLLRRAGTPWGTQQQDDFDDGHETASQLAELSARMTALLVAVDRNNQARARPR